MNPARTAVNTHQTNLCEKFPKCDTLYTDLSFTWLLFINGIIIIIIIIIVIVIVVVVIVIIIIIIIIIIILGPVSLCTGSTAA